jgi:hypothetical protein
MNLWEVRSGGKLSSRGECIRHENRHGKGALRHQAVVLLPIWICEIAALGDVPRNLGRMLRVRMVWASLADDTGYPHGHENGVGNRGEEGIPHMQDEHGRLAQEDECAQHREDQIEGSEPDMIVSSVSESIELGIRTPRTTQRGSWESVCSWHRRTGSPKGKS